MSRHVGGPMVACGLLAISVACFSEHQPAEPGVGVTCARVGEPPGADTAFVVIQGFAFNPDTARVPPGTTVIWINCETEGTPGHTTTSDGTWDSPTLRPGDWFAVVPAPGTWDYHCRPHPFMEGSVVVE